MKLKYFIRGLGVGIVFTAIILAIVMKAPAKETMTDAEIKKRAAEMGMVSQEEVGIKENELEKLVKDAAKEDLAGTNNESKKEDQQSEDSPNLLDEDKVIANPNNSLDDKSKEDENKLDLVIVDDAKNEVKEDTNADTAKTDTAKKENDKKESAKTDTAKKGNDKKEPVKADTAKKGNDKKEPVKTDTEKQKDAIGDLNANKSKSSASKSDVASITVKKGMYSSAVSGLLQKEGVIESASAFDKYLIRNDFQSRIKIGEYKIPKDATYYQIATMLTK